MMFDRLRAIFRPRDDGGRIAFLTSRVSNLEYYQEQQMARLDELSSVVADVGHAVDAVIAHVNDLEARAAQAGVEDPRIGEAVDALNQVKARLAVLLPPADAPAA